MNHIRVKNASKALRLAKRIFLTDHKKNDQAGFEIVVDGLTEDERASLKTAIDIEMRKIKYRRHKAKTSNPRYLFKLNS